MQVSSIFLLLLLSFYGVLSKNVDPAFVNNNIGFIVKDEPRIFFRQLIEASGLFPIEINVPDTISSMANGMSWMYESVSSYFNGGQGEEGDQGQEQQVLNDEVNLNSQLDNGRRRKKKVKRVKTSTDEYDIFDLISLIIF